MGELSKEVVNKLNKHVVEIIWDKKATIESKIKKVSYLIRLGADVGGKNGIGRMILLFGATGGHIELVELMLQNGVDASVRDNKGMTAMAIAFRAGYMDIVELLKKYKKIERKSKT